MPACARHTAVVHGIRLNANHKNRTQKIDVPAPGGGQANHRRSQENCRTSAPLACSTKHRFLRFFSAPQAFYEKGGVSPVQTPRSALVSADSRSAANPGEEPPPGLCWKTRHCEKCCLLARSVHMWRAI